MNHSGYAILLAFLAAQPGWSQQPDAEKTTAEMTMRDTPATFRSKVNLVLVPVIVRDSKGHAIGDLKQENFQLFDKGKPQVITRFTVEKAGGTPVQFQVEPGALEPGNDPAAKPPDPLAERFTAYIFDDVHLVFGDLARVRQAAERHLNTSLLPADRAAIFTTSGQTMLDFTDDREKLRATLLRIQPRSRATPQGLECPSVTYYMADLIQNKNDTFALQAATQDALACLSLTPDQTSMAEQAARSAASRSLSIGDSESRLSLTVLKQMIRRVAAMPGQRNIVLVSPGFITPFLQSEITDAIDSAIRSRVTVSSLDARGLYTGLIDASQRTSSLASLNARQQYDRLSALAEADILAEVADGTGGTFFQNSNDLEEGFRRVAATPEYSYVLGFSPQNLKLDGSFHKLKVTLKPSSHPTVQARRGYYAPKHLANPAEDAKREIEEALFSREVLHDIPVELHTQFFKTGEFDAKLAVLTRVDLRHLPFRKAEGRNLDNLTVVSGLFDRNGNYIQGMSKLVEMKLKDGTLESKIGAGITIKSSFDVKPGGYVIRLVVRDSEGQMMAAQNGVVEIP